MKIVYELNSEKELHFSDKQSDEQALRTAYALESGRISEWMHNQPVKLTFFETEHFKSIYTDAGNFTIRKR